MDLREIWRRTGRFAASAALGSVLSICGCKEKVPPPAPTPAAPAQPAPTAPPAAAEPQAEKDCAAPIEEGPPKDVQIGDRTAVLAGSKLSFKGPDPGGQLVLGVLGPTNEDSGPNLVDFKKYLKFFNDEKVNAIVLTGDVAEVADGIAHVLGTFAESKVPVMGVIGNRECKDEFASGIAQAQKRFSNVVNLNQVRIVEFAEATLISLPGYHDPNFMSCATGCRYYPSTVEEVIRAAKQAKSPVVLVSHGPPRGEGSQALDFAANGGNVGDPEITRAIHEAGIHFGLFSNIKEAGARATDLPGTTLVKPGVFSRDLFVNPGPADSYSWEMNDGTKSVGMAAVVAIKDGQAMWKHFRAKPLTTDEKKLAKTLESGAGSRGP